MDIERIYEHLITSCRVLEKQLKKQRDSLNYLSDSELERTFINSVNSAKALCVRVYNSLVSDELNNELTLNRMSEGTRDITISEQVEGGYFDGCFLIKLPLLPSSSGRKIAKDYSIEIAQYTNSFFVKDVSKTMLTALNGLGRKRADVYREFSSKLLIIIHNYSQDYTGKAIPDASNHYTAKLENAVLDYFPNGDGGRCAVMQMNEFIPNIPTSTYLMVLPLLRLYCGIDCRNILQSRYGGYRAK